MLPVLVNSRDQILVIQMCSCEMGKERQHRIPTSGFSVQEGTPALRPLGSLCGTHLPLCFLQSVKKFPCHLCERSFCSAPSLRRHVRVNHEGIKRVYPCRYPRGLAGKRGLVWFKRGDFGFPQSSRGGEYKATDG